jgi:hypothetical protein
LRNNKLFDGDKFNWSMGRVANAPNQDLLLASELPVIGGNADARIRNGPTPAADEFETI